MLTFLVRKSCDRIDLFKMVCQFKAVTTSFCLDFFVVHHRLELVLRYTATGTNNLV